MRKVIAYGVFNIGSVNDALAKDWQPWGNPFESVVGGSTLQAMVKYEKEGTAGGDAKDEGGSGIVPEQHEESFEDVVPDGIGAS